MSIAKWIEDNELRGKRFFSLAEVRSMFSHLRPQVVQNALSRLRKAHIIYSPYREFYVILPVTYRLRGVVPPMFYMDALMAQLNRNYYFSLLSAGVLWGAAHQRPTVDFVALDVNRPLAMGCRKRDVEWVMRSVVPEEFIRTKRGEECDVRYSCAELTALELVQYEQRVGGLGNVATVLRELLDHTSFENAGNGLFSCCKDAAVQRLGYIVENVLGDRRQAEVIYREWLKGCSTPHYVLLSTSAAEKSSERDTRWKVIINATIEEDEQ